jgi:hypothetical protein
MNLPATFAPLRRTGLIFHGALILLLAGLGSISLNMSLQQENTTTILVWMLLALALLAPLPLLLYRGYSLLQAHYTLERDGVRIRWGLRVEDMPLSDIDWVRPASEMGFPLPLPVLNWPGAILGVRTVEGLGEVEFIASERENMLLLATSERVLAISPADPRGFQRTFQRTVEMGSLSPITSYSLKPAAFWTQVWNDRLARILFISGLALNAVLLIAAVLLITSHPILPLGFDSSGQPRTPGPSERLLLLPFLSTLAFIFDLLTGMFFYRRQNFKIMAYFMWVSLLIPPALLIIVLLLMV